jgi:ketosteroid isomerase-like protein
VNQVAPGSGTLGRYYAVLDAGESAAALEMLAADLRFSILFSTPDGTTREFAGGRAEFDAYMAQRGAPEWTHHVIHATSRGALEIAFGETRGDGAHVATWVAAVRVDAGGLIDRYMVGRSPSVAFELS